MSLPSNWLLRQNSNKDQRVQMFTKTRENLKFHQNILNKIITLTNNMPISFNMTLSNLRKNSNSHKILVAIIFNINLTQDQPLSPHRNLKFKSKSLIKTKPWDTINNNKKDSFSKFSKKNLKILIQEMLEIEHPNSHRKITDQNNLWGILFQKKWKINNRMTKNWLQNTRKLSLETKYLKISKEDNSLRIEPIKIKKL